MPSKEPMHLIVITISRTSSRFIASMNAIPGNAIIRMANQHWDKQSRI